MFRVRMKRVCIVGIIALCLVANSGVMAEIVTVEVQGVVDSVDTKGAMVLDGSVEMGTPIRGYCIYDSETLGLHGSQNYEEYPMISVVMSVGNYDFTHNSQAAEPALFEVFMVNRIYSISTLTPEFDGRIYVGDAPKNWSDVEWSWSYLNVLNLWTSSLEYWQTPSLPNVETFAPLDAFDLRREFEVRMYGEGDDYFGIYGEITSLCVVPEPATIALLALCGLAMMRKRR